MQSFSLGLILVPQLYIIWRWRSIWRWLAAAPFLAIAVLAMLAHLQLGPTKDWVLLLQIVFYASPLWLGLVALARFCMTI
ncbi:MAG TPA: hypothetical protein VJ790_22290 [Dongiaceae bacterium]|nr:hypothetical protein [Dongiaceae bacterium]